MTRSSCLLLLAIAACARAPAPPPKPTAPVTVALAARPLGGAAYEVTLRAVPAADARAVELEVGGARAAFGPTRAGVARTLVTRVTRRSAGEDLIGLARVDGRARAAAVRLGAPRRAAPVPARTVTLPSGDRVAEVRP